MLRRFGQPVAIGKEVLALQVNLVDRTASPLRHTRNKLCKLDPAPRGTLKRQEAEVVVRRCLEGGRREWVEFEVLQDRRGPPAIQFCAEPRGSWLQGDPVP